MNMLRSMMAAALAVPMMLAITARAEDMAKADLGPPVGTDLPFELALKDSTGTMLGFEDLTRSNGLVLIYSRSLDWCPICKTQAQEIVAEAEGFAERGYGVAIVTYDAPEKLAAFAEKHGAEGVTLLSDPDSSTIDALGIRNEDMKAGSRFDGIPNPIVFVVTPDQTIAAKLYQDDYRDRPALGDVFSELEEVAANYL